MDHLPAEEAAFEFAAQSQPAAHGQRLLLGRIETEEAQHAGVAAIVHGHHQLAARSVSDFAGRDGGFDLRGVAFARVAQPDDARFVLVPQRQVQSQVDVAREAQLQQGLLRLGQGLGFGHGTILPCLPLGTGVSASRLHKGQTGHASRPRCMATLKHAHLHARRFRFRPSPRPDRPASRHRTQRLAPARWHRAATGRSNLPRSPVAARTGRPAGLQRHTRGEGAPLWRETDRRQGRTAVRARAGRARNRRPHEGEQEAAGGHAAGHGGRFHGDPARTLARCQRPAVPVHAQRRPPCVDGTARPCAAAPLHRTWRHGARRRALPDGLRQQAGRGGGADGGPALRPGAADAARSPRRAARQRDAARGRGNISAGQDREHRRAHHAQRVVRRARRHAAGDCRRS